MSEARFRQVIIAGAGIAGLTAALSFAVRGFPVRIFERAPRVEDAGAGIQLSPNATRILDRLGVLAGLRPAAVRPSAVILRDASSLAELARVPLGAAGELRWKSPYLTVQRADLQSALLAHVAREPEIQLITGANVRDAAFHAHGVTVSVDTAGGIVHAAGFLFIGADGVWSASRGLTGAPAKSVFSGEVAWRRTVRAESPAGRSLIDIGVTGAVTAFVHPRFHLVAYPVRGGNALNLVAITRGKPIAEGWSGKTDTTVLKAAMRRTAPALTRLAEDPETWTAWPIHTARSSGPWTAPGGIALIGDAAHAMTPYAAQGAAMAIEDAEMLARHVAAKPTSLATALVAWEKERRPRILRTAKRGASNHFAWHASGPIAAARNLFLRARSPEKLAADLDWLYGWEPSNPK